MGESSTEVDTGVMTTATARTHRPGTDRWRTRRMPPPADEPDPADEFGRTGRRPT